MTGDRALALDQLHQGDCLELFRAVVSGSIDLVFADPPFNIGYDYDLYDDRRDANVYLDWSRQWAAEVARVLKPTGTFWLAIGDEFAAELKLIFQREQGLIPRSWVIWYYTFGVHCTKKFARSHAHLFHFVKDPKQFTFNDQEIRVPSARQLVYSDRRADPKGRLPDDTWILRPQDVPGGFPPDGDTWYFPRICGTFKERAGWHGCQMPEQLLGRIIRACSNPGEVVLDPFAGSGTTLVVAKKLGRRHLGFELSPDYAAQIRSRLDVAHEGQRLEGGEEPLAGGKRTPGVGVADELPGPRPAWNVLVSHLSRHEGTTMNDTAVHYAVVEAPIGGLLLLSDGASLTGLYLESQDGRLEPDGLWVRDDSSLKPAVEQLAAYFAGDLRRFDVPLAPRGTEFQRRVWDALRAVPFGTTVSYAELARRIGMPRAARAVGLAVGRNPISIIVPCHRVVGSDGGLTGYAGGLARKRWLLDHERTADMSPTSHG